MADVSSPVGGGRFKQFVKELIQAEREPIRQAEARKVKQNDKLKLLQEFQGKMRKIIDAYRELDSSRKFRELKADWPDKDLLDVTVDKDLAETGEYQIEIVQLAGRHSMISDGYESPDDEVGVGYFNYELPSGETKSVYIGGGDSTLRGVVNAINKERDLDVQASLVNDGSGGSTPWRIVVAAKKSGMTNDITFPEFYFLDGDIRFYVDDERSAQNAIIKFNGFEIMSPANRFELLQGVSLDLKQAKEGHEFTVIISEDIPKIAGKVKALVEAINGSLEFVNKQNKLDATSDTSRTLGGDTTLFTVESRIRNWVFQSFGVDPDDEEMMMNLSQVGIQFEKTGLLSFKEDKFKKALESDFDSVRNLFVMEGNFIDKIHEMTDSFLRPEVGALGAREKGIKDRIKAIDEDIARKESAIQRREQTLKRQFATLESLMSSMQGQQQYLQQAMGGGGGVIPGL